MAQLSSSVRFNPCFSGMWFLTYDEGFKRLGCIGVSILVLVECGFLHKKQREETKMTKNVSILVLVECGFLQEIRDLQDDLNVIRFNPCFSGMWFLTDNRRVQQSIQ